VAENATEFRDDPGRSRRVVKEQFPEVTLGFCCLKRGIGAPIGKPWLWKIGIVCGHHQLLDAADLLVDELPQLIRTVTLRSRAVTDNEQQQHGEDLDGTAWWRGLVVRHGYVASSMKDRDRHGAYNRV
jgi:hypothetical protein